MSVFFFTPCFLLITISTISLTVFARTDYNGPPLTHLVDIIDYVKPTALMGLSTIPVMSGVRMFRAQL